MSGIGALRERVTLLHPVRTPDGGGGHEIAWEERGAVWAAAEDRTAARFGVNGAPRTRRRFTLRGEASVLYETRLVHDGQAFRVTSIRRSRGSKPYQTIDAEAV